MKTKYQIYFFLAAAVSLSACGGSKKTEAEQKREAWLASLNDSIALYQKQMEGVSAELSEVQRKVGEMVGDFDYVNNPREVEGYYIYKGWKSRYPLTQTGLVARVTEDERFELIATLTGGFFNEIAATSDGVTASSGVVPHDQALNYRAGNLNKVCFSGEKADSVGALIAAHQSGPVTVSYLDGRRTGSLQLPADERLMVAATWQLYSMQKKAHSLEKEMPRLSGKISACRRLLEGDDNVENPN